MNAPDPRAEPGSGERAPAPLNLRLTELTALASARDRIHAYLAARAVPEATLYAVDLALEELVSNALRHGYGGRGEVRVELEYAPRLVRLRLTDRARAFDPTRQPEPPPFTTLEEAPIGGLGISMVRKVVHALRYRRVDGCNETEIELRVGDGGPLAAD